MRRRIIAVANQKGGVGKTTTTVNLATALAAIRKKVLLVDFDPQGNATTSLGIDFQSRYPGIYEFMSGEFSLSVICRQTYIPNLYILPSSPDLSGAEVELVNTQNREKQLKDKLGNLDFEYVLIDCPPSLGLLTINALTAADSVLVPLQCEYFALEGLSQLLKTIKHIRTLYNPSLELQGIVMTMFDGRNALNQSVIDDVRHHMKETVYQTIIPRNIRVSEAPSHGKPVLIYDMRSSGAQAYIRLASEIIRQERRRQYAA